MAAVYPLTDPSELGETDVDADALGTQLQRWDLGTLTEKPADQLVAYDGLVEPKYDVLVMIDTYGNVSFYVPSESKLLVFNIGPASGRGARALVRSSRERSARCSRTMVRSPPPTLST